MKIISKLGKAIYNLSIAIEDGINATGKSLKENFTKKEPQEQQQPQKKGGKQ